jgi:iron complex transport system ATP-binding protein
VTVERASFGYKKDRAVFRDVSFSLSSGDVLAILGANGAGKSTLLNCMAGVFRPQRGAITVNGRDIREYSTEKLALELAYIPQSRGAVFDFSVRDYVVMGRAPHIGLMRTPCDEEYRIADQALERMRLSRLVHESCRNISGGELQQVRIARALAQRADIILMDEPTNHLDCGNQNRVLKTIAELSKEGYIIVMTTHIPDHAILLDGIAAIMQPGGSMQIGPAGEIVNEKNLASIYDTELRIVYVSELGRMACLSCSLN